MKKLRARHLNSDLCNICQGEIRVLQLENKELKHHHKALISAVRQDQEAMLLEIERLKTELQKAEAMSAHALSRETVACPSQ